MSTVPSINLLPQRRVRLLHARAVARWWVVGGLAWCVVALVSGGVYSVGLRRQTAGDGGAVVVAAKLEAKRAEKQSLTARVSDLRRRVDAARAVGHHADWSVLLRHLAMARPATLIMEQCELRRVTTTTRTPGVDGKPETVSTETRQVFVIAGLAEQMSDVHAFVGRVEASGIFDRVRLGQTSVVTSPGVGQPALTKYTIECELDEPTQGGEP